jgi:hypothetical protein
MFRAVALSAKIVSGPQTGADRAALDFAIENGIPHGGWCPRASRDSETHFRGCNERSSHRITESRASDYERLTHNRTAEMAAWKY